MSRIRRYNVGDKIKNCLFTKELEPINKDRVGQFICHCGKEFVCRLHSVTSGKTSSCGCVYKHTRRTISLKHGQSIGNETPEYRSWGAMKSRCNNADNHAYNDYGGRGIFVCEMWNNSFINFFNDMGKRPTIKHTLERRDNDKGYNPENCYWATKKEQSNNKRSSILITYNNKTQTLKLWCEEFGLKYKQIHKRIHQFGWPSDKAFTLGKTHGSRYVSQRKVA